MSPYREYVSESNVRQVKGVMDYLRVSWEAFPSPSAPRIPQVCLSSAYSDKCWATAFRNFFTDLPSASPLGEVDPLDLRMWREHLIMLV